MDFDKEKSNDWPEKVGFFVANGSFTIKEEGKMDREFMAQMKLAVIRVMRCLPDRRVEDTEKVVRVALAGMETDQDMAESIIRKLVSLSPRCYGIYRRAGYWRIVFQYLSREEAADAYLSKFPSQLTREQDKRLREYLSNFFFLSHYGVMEKMVRFGRRENAACSGERLW